MKDSLRNIISCVVAMIGGFSLEWRTYEYNGDFKITEIDSLVDILFLLASNHNEQQSKQIEYCQHKQLIDHLYISIHRPLYDADKQGVLDDISMCQYLSYSWYKVERPGVNLELSFEFIYKQQDDVIKQIDLSTYYMEFGGQLSDLLKEIGVNV
jgi:hypothetical protein